MPLMDRIPGTWGQNRMGKAIAENEPLTQLAQLMKNYREAYPTECVERLIDYITSDMETLAQCDDSFSEYEMEAFRMRRKVY